MKVTTTNIAFLALAVLTSAVPIDPTTEQQSGEAVPLKPLAPSSLDAPRDFGITESAGDLSSIPSRKEFEIRPRPEAAGDLGHPSDLKSLRGSGSDRSDALDGSPGAGTSGYGWPPSGGTGTGTGTGGYPGWPPSSGAGTGTGTGTSGYGWPPSGGTGTGTGTLGTVVGPGLAQALKEDLGEDKVDIEGLQYPADWAGNANMGATGGVVSFALSR
ncbi:uncharacterized protein MYCGRDRAFT_89811 [Zymoseptoria tritici IPO323]|uniref:Uncharacterized protein n=1 Tax=Zymoseptoria tritici (strain CBS 115943 / IPO323) TaxID=336722 RepID=F9WYC8_ZYMTI|nr:uncharacterized protein MYCGRDRAFT_89811 [Zymoseptoria tritici IPO323]EGP92112.1 hypothetical protein MYCGRDRAFT_89811 [Zymoseptoria tritici IPO323]